MWRVTPTKGDSFVVNGEHVLSLKATCMYGVTYREHRPNLPYVAKWCELHPEKVIVRYSKSFKTQDEAHAHIEAMKAKAAFVESGTVVDVTVRKYLDNIKRIGARNLFLYRPDFVDYPAQPIEAALDPYVLGVWLGDGTTMQPEITSADKEIVDRVRELLPVDVEMTGRAQRGAAMYYRIKKAPGVRGVGVKCTTSSVKAALFKYGLIGNKHIPAAYLHNTRDVRLKVLAGILDTDGGYQKHTNQFSLTLKVERLIDDVVVLARSLGFACYKKQIQSKCCNNGKIGTYYTVNIVGAGLEEIPTVLPRKQARERVKAKDVRRVGFTLERVEDDHFYGFELDGNHRYLMEDFIVLHNSNSKSFYLTLFEKAFGDYCIKFPITLLTQKRAMSNAATPEIARARGKRLASLQEPSEDEKLNIGLMKELSGGDRIQARGLFKEPIEFNPQFKMLLLCNHLPSVPSEDGGTWRRIRVVEFASRFCDNPRPNMNEFPIDYDMNDKLNSWREHFMALLIHNFDRYQAEGLKEPEAVVKVTKAYRESNDHVARFVTETVVKVDETAFVTVDELLSEFQDWAKRENIPQTKGMKRADFDQAIARVTGLRSVLKKGGRQFKGLKIVREDDAPDDAPATTSEAPAASSRAPAATSDAPSATSRAPAASSCLPTATSDAPAATSDAPSAT